ncbi:hypothetical protein KM043_012337 [Ampulex compressa]|nr:hypothetical protein KM043_012337 [Ampulex compressa]
MRRTRSVRRGLTQRLADPWRVVEGRGWADGAGLAQGGRKVTEEVARREPASGPVGRKLPARDAEDPGLPPGFFPGSHPYPRWIKQGAPLDARRPRVASRLTNPRKRLGVDRLGTERACPRATLRYLAVPKPVQPSGAGRGCARG